MPALIDSEGKLASTRGDRDGIWLGHFGRQECGSVVATSDFISRPDTGITIDQQLEWTLADIPTYFEIEQAFRKIPSRKSMGLDNLPGELLKADPCGITKAVYPLFLKATLSFRQPLQWRGGLLREAWKRKGTVQCPGNYRSLFVSSMLGKTFHKVLRAHMRHH